MLSEVQKDFSSAYPFLKIEFFKNGFTRQSRYPAHQQIDRQQKIKDSWIYKKDSGQIEITDAMTVHELENAFIDQFGLCVQVFRKSGNIWLETTMTDNWTLKQQSDHAMEIVRGSKTVYRPYQDREPNEND